MGRLLKGFAAGVFGLVALAVLLYVVSRALPIPKDEAEALARIEALPVLEGRNGFAALWSLAHDVDTSQSEALLAEEARRMAAAPSVRGESESQASVSALQRFPTLPTVPEKTEAFCGMHEAACLAKVRRDPAVYASVAEGQQRAAAKVAALDAYDYFLNPLPPRMDAALPPYQPLIHDLTLQAQRFSVGDVDAALEGVCRDASLSRKLIASGDSLIASMVGAALQKGSAALFVDMLSELPPDHPLPAICHQAFRVDEMHVQAICPTLRAEGRWSADAYSALTPGDERRKLLTSLFLDVDKTVARGTRNFEWYCGKEVDAAIAADLPVPLPAPHTRLSFSCVANAIGCTLVSIQAPAYADYALRLQDAGMRQKAVATWLWLRAQSANDTRPLVERLRSRPDEFRSAARDITVDGGMLKVPMYERRPGQGDAWRLPVPAWMADTER